MEENAPIKLLLIDDEPMVREPLAQYLEGQGFEIIEAENAARARSFLRGHHADLALLDIMMPGEDGLSLCRHLVESQQMPVILLTAKGEATDRIIGLEMGADDYIVKPFEPRELVARIRSVMRRVRQGDQYGNQDGTLCYFFEGWRLDPVKHRLHNPDNILVPISTAEFRLLKAFVDHPHQVLDRDQLLEMVQQRSAHLFDRAVDNQVSRLRRKIELDSRNPQFIQTIRGGGYCFTAQVRRGPCKGGG